MDYALASVIISAKMLLLTFISVLVAFNLYKHQKRRAHKETACKLAKYYADSIISRISYVSLVLSECDFGKYTKEAFPISKIGAFDKEELERLCREHSIEVAEIDKSVKELDPRRILAAKLQLGIGDRNTLKFEMIEFEQNNKYAEVVKSDFTIDVYNLLNDMEYFAMTCRLDVADESALFQSIHQSFLSNVCSLYYFISRKNDSLEDKYYTNIIWLFNKWYSDVKDIKQKRDSAIAKAKRQSEKYAESKSSRSV